MWLTCQMRFPTSEHHRTHERGDAGRDVNDSAAGEVEHAPFVQEPVRMPRPMREWAIDDDAPEADKEQITREADAFRKRSGDERRRDDGEFQLEEREQHERDRRRERHVRLRADVTEHQECSWVADEAANAVAEGEAET